MMESEERPSKIRKLNSGVAAQEKHEIASSALVGSKENSYGGVSEAGDSKSPIIGTEIVTPSANQEGDQETQSVDPSLLLSKNQLKKLRKKQEWEAGREHRKAKRKEKDKEKKARKKEEQAVAEQQSTEAPSLVPDQPKKSHQRPIQVPITFLLDCDFDDLMTEAEMTSLGSQLTRCYSDNRSAPYRAHMVVSSFGGNLKRRFETVLASNHLSWKGVTFTDANFVTAATEADKVMRGSQGGRLIGALAGKTMVESAPNGEESKQEVPSLTPPAVSEQVGDTSMQEAETVSEVEHKGLDESPLSTNKETAPPRGRIESKDEATDVNTTNDRAKTRQEANNSSSTTSPTTTNPSTTIPPPPPSIIYLSSDSPHTLDVLSPYTTYIIGGLVDKNRHKGICYKRAREHNIPTAKLPIGEYMTMQSRTVLATNHVMEIMLRWLEDGDWGKAFLRVIPKRKEAKLKAKVGTMGNGDANGEVAHGGEAPGAEGAADEGEEVDREENAGNVVPAASTADGDDGKYGVL